ncbi:MAG: RNA 3'-terminal phosphate cyclase (ATP) [Halobacteriales archaeon]|jgi:RNA 3'-terminal phosphate cyclase (ATP)
MRELDGSEAGGQFLRTALALAALDGDPVTIEGIRGARSTPGLRPQHLTAVRLLAEICDAAVEGASEGSTDVTFRPDEIRGGRYSVDVGTAGSLTLLFDAVLPLATRLDEPLAVTATGGTDVKWSPTMAYFRRVKLPLLRKHGLQAAVEVDRRGFYPAGGGRATLWLAPSSIDPIDLTDRGTPTAARVDSTATTDLADASVAERQADAVVEPVSDVEVPDRSPGSEADLPVVERTVRTVEADSAGSAVLLRIDASDAIAGFDALGEKGTPAEDVGREAVDAAREFLATDAAVDRHMGDQLAVFLALAGGRVRIPAATDHVTTSVDLLRTFGYDASVEGTDAAPTLVGDGITSR